MIIIIEAGGEIAWGYGKKDRALSKIRKNIFTNPLMVIMMEGGGVLAKRKDWD